MVPTKFKYIDSNYSIYIINTVITSDFDDNYNIKLYNYLYQTTIYFVNVCIIITMNAHTLHGTFVKSVSKLVTKLVH